MARSRSPDSPLSHPDGRVVAAIEMMLEDGDRRVGIAGLDRVDDALVLVHDLVEDLGRSFRAERRHPDEAAELPQERSQDRELSAFRDPEMEPLVEVEELVVPPFP